VVDDRPLFTRDQRVRLKDWVGKDHLSAIQITAVNSRRMVVIEPAVSASRYGNHVAKVREWPGGVSWFVKECYLEPDPDP
jgi:hypothetical protein